MALATHISLTSLTKPLSSLIKRLLITFKNDVAEIKLRRGQTVRLEEKYEKLIRVHYTLEE